MSHTIHIHHSVISPSRMSSTRPIISEWASVVSRRKLQLACAGGRRDVSILHRLVLISNFERHAHDIEPLPAPLPATEPDAFVFPTISDQPQSEAEWLDAILSELDDEAEVMVALEDPAALTQGGSTDDDDNDVIVCDSYFSICSCPQPPQSPPEGHAQTDDLSESLSDLPFYSTPSLSDSMDIDSDSDGPVTPDISFAVDSDSPGCQPFDDPDSPLQSLFDEPVSRSPIIRTCVPHNPFFISTYC